MPTVYYSYSPFGTGDIKTGSPNIVISSGVATLDVAQTGNIGIGTMIEYNSLKCVISQVNSSTSFNVLTVTGGTPSDQSSVAVTSIHHIWASLADAEAAYMGASFLNSTDFSGDSIIVYLCAYYDHDDSTVDASVVTFDTATTDSTYHPIVYAPNGGTESINSQRSANGVFDTTKYYMSNSDASGCITMDIDYSETIGLQIYPTATSVFASPWKTPSGGSSTGVHYIRNCILRGGSYGVRNYTAETVYAINCVVYDADSGGIGNSNSSAITNFYYCTLYDNYKGEWEYLGTVNMINCIVFGNADQDFTDQDVGSITYTASDDSQAGTGNFILGTYSSIFNNYSASPPDFNLLDFDGTGCVKGKGVAIGGITDDIIGEARGNPPDCGAFEFPNAGPSYGAIEKDYQTDTFVNSLEKVYNGAAWVQAVDKVYLSGAWELVDNDG